ncbi:MAG: hydroxylamine reductase [Candidatus Melainabacteria bacterium]|nr:hydroxylamine reductase [Candidatus Melainabacteria bacterium]
MDMFCYQCEQTAHQTGCTTLGVCGKTPETAGLQDVIVFLCKQIATYTSKCRRLNVTDISLDSMILKMLFVTLTNVNFDSDEHVEYIKKLQEGLNTAKRTYVSACKRNEIEPQMSTFLPEWNGSTKLADLFELAAKLRITQRMKEEDPSLVGLEELLTYGLKGLAAYSHHAYLLGYWDERIFAYISEALEYLGQEAHDKEMLFSLVIRCGEANFIAMELLDKAHTSTFGHPEPTNVRITPVEGKCILVSGHDLESLREVLVQTQNQNINVYTHGELLPANSYPGLKKFKHLVGNYGGAWQNQNVEFAEFPGSILLTTNCLKPPLDSYKDRLFTIDTVGFSDVKKIKDYDFTPLINSAKKEEGFKTTEPEKTILIGFGRNAVMSVADKVIDAVKSKAVRHIFLIGGCDGAELNRNYYTHLAEEVPQDCLILTLGCGKFRFNKEEFSQIGGLPRMLDMGQCNDAYSAIKVASALAEVFEVGINDLPLSIVLSWFEQKAVAVLLTLLYLGVENIRIGPNLPAFIGPELLNELVVKFKLKPIGTPSEDLVEMLA